MDWQYHGCTLVLQPSFFIRLQLTDSIVSNYFFSRRARSYLYPFFAPPFPIFSVSFQSFSAGADLSLVLHFALVSQYKSTMVQNTQEPRRRYWATRLSVHSLAHSHSSLIRVPLRLDRNTTGTSPSLSSQAPSAPKLTELTKLPSSWDSERFVLGNQAVLDQSVY